jgi:hypothetical protein
MKRKDIEKAFSELTLAEMSPVLEALTRIHHSAASSRRKELEEEMNALDLALASTGGGHVVGNPRRPGRSTGGGHVVGNPRRGGGVVDNGLKASKRASPKPKYRGPNGETWAGRGGTPRWMADLIAKGKKKEDFLI